MKKLHPETGSAPLFVVMMAGALGLIIGYSLARLTTSTASLMKSAVLGAQLDRLHKEIYTVLSDAKLCPTAFRDGSNNPLAVNPGSAPVTVNKIFSGYYAGARPIAAQGSPTTGLAVTTIQLKNPVPIHANSYNWTLSITTEKRSDTTTLLPGAAITVKNFHVAITTTGNPNYTITSCYPLGGKLALGPMSALRATSSLSANCNNNGDKDTQCTSLYGSAYRAASRGDLLAFGMLQSAAGASPPPATNIQPFGLYGLNSPLFMVGGAESWSLYRQSNVAAGCNVLCINKNAPLQFTRGTAASNVNVGAASKDAICRGELGSNYAAATFNDFAQAGWTSSGSVAAGSAAAFSAVIAGHDHQVDFQDDSGGNLVMAYATSGTVTLPVACVRR